MGALHAKRLLHQHLRDDLQRNSSTSLLVNFLLPRAFGRRLVSFSPLLRTPPESLAGSPGSFVPSSEEEVVGQTAPRWPSSPGSSTCGVGAEVGVFLETKAFSL